MEVHLFVQSFVMVLTEVAQINVADYICEIVYVWFCFRILAMRSPF